MAVRSSTVGSGSRGGFGGKVVAAMAWGVAVWTTDLFISVLAPEGTNALLVAFIIQAIFSAAESPIWRGKAQWYNYVVLGVDTVTNVGGLYFYILQLDRTDSWAAFSQGLGTTGGMSPLAALIVSIVFGVLLAATPEFLWRQQ